MPATFGTAFSSKQTCKSAQNDVIDEKDPKHPDETIQRFRINQCFFRETLV